jgi:hypothetical protein
VNVKTAQKSAEIEKAADKSAGSLPSSQKGIGWRGTHEKERGLAFRARAASARRRRLFDAIVIIGAKIEQGITKL